MNRIALLEDDIRVAHFISEGLKAESYEVEHFSKIDLLIDTLEEHNFDVIIMDRMIDKSDSIGSIQAIRKIKPEIKIIILSALAGSINRIRGLEIGADDYLEKPFQFHELSLRVKKISTKDSHELESVISYEDLTLELESQKMQRGGKNINLSPYEFKIMTIFIRHPYRVHSRTEFLDRIWGCNSGTTSNVVDVAMAKLKKKINYDTTTQLINARRGSGYILSGHNS